MFKKRFTYFFILVLVASCASTGLKDRADLRLFIEQKQFDQALKFVEGNEFFKQERSQLLYFLEKGLILHYKGDYFQSAQVLNDAKELSEKLFTKSISSSAKTAITNDSYDIYYGEKYERSLIHYYLSLNHLLLFQQGKYEAYTVQEGEAVKQVPEKILSDKEKKEELFRARAEVLAWDTFLSTIKKDRAGETVFKDDLLAKMFGAFVHETVGTRADMQIALTLYVDAYHLLFQNYNRYSSLNFLSQKFQDDYSKLPQMDKTAIKIKYISPTSFQTELVEYIQLRVLVLTQKYRGQEWNKYVKALDIPKAIQEKARLQKQHFNVGIVLQQGLIPSKVPDKHYYGLEQAMRDPNSSGGVKAAAAIGHLILTVFAAEKLGLLPPPGNYDPVKAHVGLNVASIAAEKIAFAFELPKIENRPLAWRYQVRVVDAKGVEVYQAPIVLSEPLGDVAAEGVAEHASSTFVRTGLRTAGKHLAAIAASYATYKAMEKSGEFFAKTAAVVQYIGASKGIEASEQADTRFWSTLPESIRLNDFYVPKGDYKLEVYRYTIDSEFNLASAQKMSESPLNVDGKDQKKIMLLSL